MKITIESGDGSRIPRHVLTIESDGEGNYTITGDNLPRQDGGNSYTTSDGLHVLGLLHLVAGAFDSQEYLLRRLREHGEEQKS